MAVLLSFAPRTHSVVRRLWRRTWRHLCSHPLLHRRLVQRQVEGRRYVLSRLLLLMDEGLKWSQSWSRRGGAAGIACLHLSVRTTDAAVRVVVFITSLRSALVRGGPFLCGACGGLKVFETPLHALCGR